MNRILDAIAQALRDKASHRKAPLDADIPPLSPAVRIDGKLCLVTGANTGLGKAVAVDLARRGGHVLMACRGGHPEAGEDVRRASGSDRVDMLNVDLSDLHSVHGLCDALRDRAAALDIAVLNAGLMPARAGRSRQGFELMFAVHFLANRVLVERWLGDGVIRASTGQGEVPRIVFVASEAHRSSEPIDFDRFGAFVDYGIRDGLKHYGHSKLHLCTFATELSRQLNAGDETAVAVHALCPGPVASDIARDAPPFLKPILQPTMKLFFLSPAKAARPVSYLCCAEDAGARSGMYLHMMREKRPSDLATDPANGARLWDASARLLRQHAPDGAA